MIGFLYAGQGSQTPGMGQDLYEAYPAFREIFDSAPVDFDLKETCFTGAHLNETQYTQPCMVAFAAGVTALLKEKGVEPAMAAGLSLGEYSALCAAGVWDAPTAIRLAAFRGRAMTEAAAGIDSAMLAVLGLDRGKLQEACDKASDLGVVSIANYNCPGQLVIAGERAAVEQAAVYAKAAGARRAMPLNTSGPFHTRLLEPAARALHGYFQQIPFASPRFPVLHNCLGDVAGPADTIQSLLERQVMCSVCMEDSIRRMGALGVDTFVEIGPGKVLSGFVRKTLPGAVTYAVTTAGDLERAAAALKGETVC
ncbi:MAG: ACP S-malonyltransferase [Oscillospiraceae bacterium]|nr:ACP S-malonyltransferase [Oscillospiraceae bacterium]